jgi:RNA polymerase sigma-70 factor (ECF subfamily)
LPDRLDETDRHEALARALEHLPDHQRVPLVLYHYEDKSYQDIATLLGVSLGKIKTDIHRGREALRQHVAHHGSH